MTLEIVDLAKNPFWASLQTAQKYNTLLLEFAAINIGTTFKYAEKLLSVKSVPEFVDVATNYSREQFEALEEQVEELLELADKVSSGNGKAKEFGFWD